VSGDAVAETQVFVDWLFSQVQQDWDGRGFSHSDPVSSAANSQTHPG